MSVAETGPTSGACRARQPPESDAACSSPSRSPRGAGRGAGRRADAAATSRTTPCSNAPLLADCQAAELVPIAPPAAGDGAVVQDEARGADRAGRGDRGVQPDPAPGRRRHRHRRRGRRLRRADDGTTYEVDDLRAVSTLGELKSFTPDGQAVLVAAFTTLPERAANPDIVRRPGHR